MASITQEQITAALKKLGPVSPGALADHLQVDRSALGYQLKPMLDAGTLKASGSTINRRVALPDQKFDTPDAPPPAGPKVESEEEESPARRGQAARAASFFPLEGGARFPYRAHRRQAPGRDLGRRPARLQRVRDREHPRAHGGGLK